MKLSKPERDIISACIGVPLVIVLASVNKHYYLDQDEDDFRSKYLFLIQLCIGVLLLIPMFLKAYKTRKQTKVKLTPLVGTTIVAGLFLFILRDFTVSIAFFINRQYARTTEQKAYVAGYKYDMPKSKETLNLYDVQAKHITTDENLINYIYKPGLNERDTIKVTFQKGLFGVNYIPNPPDEEE